MEFSDRCCQIPNLLAGGGFGLLRRRFVVSLLAGIHCGTELVFLLRDVVAATIDPGSGLLARLPGAVCDDVTTLFGGVTIFCRVSSPAVGA